MDESSQNAESLNGKSGEPSRANYRALMVRDTEPHALSPYAVPSAGAPYFESDGGGVSIIQLLHSFRRRWLLALCAGLMMGLPLAALVWLVAPDPYEVAAWLHVGDPQNINGNPQSRNVSEFDYYRKTQATLIKSPVVLQSALSEPGIAELPILRDKREPQKFLEEELTVVAPMDSELLQIKMRGKDAQQLVKIVNAVKKSYLDNIVNADYLAKLKSREVVETNYKGAMEELQKKHELAVKISKQTNSGDLTKVQNQIHMYMEQSAQLMREIGDTNSELTQIRAKVAMLKDRDPAASAPSQHLIELTLARDPQIASQSQQLDNLQEQLQIHLSQSVRGLKDPESQRLKGMIEAVTKQLDDRRASLTPGIVQQLKAEMGNDENELQKAQSTESVLQESLKKLEEKFTEITQKNGELGDVNSQGESLTAEMRQWESTAASARTKLDQLNMELSLPQRVTSLSDAVVPEGTNPVLRYMLTVFGGMVGLVLGAGAVVAVEYQAHHLNTTTEVGSNAGLRVLGTVPNLSSVSRAKGLNDSDVLHGVLAESLDSIRTILLQHSREAAPHVILISSAGDREGKTTVAAHLAASLARSGRRTLLVDADLRSPTAHLIFGAAPEPGLCEVLRGDVDFSTAMQPTQIDSLMFIPGGQCDYASIAALSKSNLSQVLQTAREQFEFIVIDTAPVLTYADTLLIGNHVDAALLSVRRDVSRIHKVNEARERLESVGIKVLGAVVNGIMETSRRPAFALPASV